MKNIVNFFVVLMVFSVNAGANTPPSEASKAQRYLDSDQSIRFEQNVGQFSQLGSLIPSTDVKFVVKGGDHKILLLSNGLAHQFEKKVYPSGYNPNDRHLQIRMEQEMKSNQVQLETYRMDMILVGAKQNARVSREGKSAYPEHYYKEESFTAWTYEKVTYHNIYPHIDWVIYSQNNKLKYDFIIHPGGDPSVIQLQFNDAGMAGLEGDGSFKWSNPMGWVQEKAPESFQGESKIESRYEFKNGILSFILGKYDTSESLRIDPTLLWGTYYGSSAFEHGRGIASDGSGNVFVTGYSSSPSGIATTGAHQVSLGGGQDAFVVKFDSFGVRQWGTYYGGSSDDVAYNIATDGSGNVLVTGSTESTSGIATTGAHQSSIGGGQDAFVVKFNSSGVRQWGTYYGGPGYDYAADIATDGSGNVLVTGVAGSSSMATAGAHQTTSGGSSDAFVLKFDSLGVRQWCTYYGGTGFDQGRSIASDGSDNVLVAGYTGSGSDIATTGAYQSTRAGSIDAFVVKFSSGGVRQWGTYYGGASDDVSTDIATDGSDNVLVTGWTQSTSGIASTGAHQVSYGGAEDAFVVKFNSSGVLQWGTYYGGASVDDGNGIATDGSGNVFVTGFTKSTSGIATTGAHQVSFGGSEDAFVVKFNDSGALQWGTYYGGSNLDYGFSIATDVSGNVLVSGYTISTSGIATTGAHQTTPGGTDAFIAKFSGIFLIPEIVNDPKSVNICISEDTSFSLSINGVWDSLQWQMDTGSGWQRVSGGMDTTYGITNPDTSLNGAQYRAIAFGPGGNDTTTTVGLTLRFVTVSLNNLLNPSSGQSNGSIDLDVRNYGNFIRYCRWSGQAGENYPTGSDFDLSNAPAGIYYMMLVTEEQCVQYEGPYTLGTGPR